VARMAIWIAFDFGFDGPYEEMYRWLDKQKALECGTNVAFLLFPKSSNLYESVLNQVQANVGLRPTDRVYVVCTPKSGEVKGKFIHGSRRRAPWENFAQSSDDHSGTGDA
jgi:hypothetical protein